MNINNVNKTNDNKVEVGMGHLSVYGQPMFKGYEGPMFKGYEGFVNQSQEQVKNTQQNTSKISRIGRRLLNISKNEFFKFNSKVDFSIQRESLKRMGASEVGSIFVGQESALKLMTGKVLKALGREIPFEDNLSMRKGKALENLGFDEFIRIYSDNIQVLHKNKYANGIDKYNYFKKINGEDTLVGSTIDGWFVNTQGEAELLEIKCSDNLSLRSAILEYNKTGNFLDNRYFFKYYIQVQIQLACTGLDKGNLFFLIGNEAINCVIIRNNDLISKVMLFVKELDREVNHICTLLRAQTDIDIKTTSLEELSVHINNILAGSVLYQSLSQLDYKFEFMEFVKSINLELSKEKSLYLKGRLMTINHLQLHMNDIEKEHALNLAKITKPVKDEIKTYMDEICKEYSLLEHVNYKFDSNLFVIDTTKRAIKDRLRSLTGIDNFIFSSYSPVNLTAI
ncbi:DUF244 domain-containing protein (plasmid) [Borrelia miyamotoi]|uniref:DUF244 domain-containing protein n=1 Tax=Borrelia miyamotoi TaxID=47466 RepID=A0AAQ3CP82_9SPIR|nr:DUF244 domain-containing protein [Borrelia miyamotoi]ATQ19165.1 DUF244 domain-containing protein [Borrelia miyamotoi]WCL22377.1 DUF244 domain-containing protein [Borrelia miyamotoi]WDE70641.1 DUF244 domain-containing protein [Borrelia miyamotoi]WDE71956.1 DUF244 domain-containing protein [Borrelia miyamotoi]WDE73424.1 DUF244 domain-containing protein [Borrelia miyamotoi]